MKTTIRDFCEVINKIGNPGVSISIGLTGSIIGTGIRSFSGVERLNFFDLDREDIDYLYKKYSRRIVLEMQENVKEIEDKYSAVFQK